MRIYKVCEDGSVDHWVLAGSEEDAIAMVRKIAGDGMEEDTELIAEEVPYEKALTICLDGYSKVDVTHILEEVEVERRISE